MSCSQEKNVLNNEGGVGVKGKYMNMQILSQCGTLWVGNVVAIFHYAEVIA